MGCHVHLAHGTRKRCRRWVPRRLRVWDGPTQEGRPAEFTTLDFFRIEDGLIAEQWASVDWVGAYQSFGLLPDAANDEPSN